MGRVFLVGDLLQGDRLVALKTLRPGLLSDSAIERLKQEFRAMVRLRHPNLARVYDFGILDEGRVPFITLEYLEGKDLSQFTPAEIRPTLPELIAQLCRALDYIHTRAVLHNDIKPQNIVVLPLPGGRDEPSFDSKLMDFGLAQFLDQSEQSVRSGTLHYSAPEILTGGKVDPRSDLYSLGVVLYRLATGRLPFTAKEPLEIVRAHQEAQPVPPRTLDPSLSPGLDRLILWLLEKNPADRPRSAAVLIRSLNESLGREFPLETRESRESYLTGAELVGRESEMDFLRAALAGATRLAPEGQSASTPRLVLVGGESGSGKSRLLREFRYQVQTEGPLFLVGSCYEAGGGAYQPFVEAFRYLAPEVRSLLEGSDSGDVDRRLIQLLSPLFPDLLAASSSKGLPPAGDADGKAQLFEAAAQVLDRLGARRPFVLALEDVHWADALTIELLRHLRDRTGKPRYLLVATYRDDEVANRPLESLAVGAATSQQSILRLRRLDLGEIARLIRSMFTLQEEPEDLALLLLRQTGGNPLFIEETLKALAEEKALERTEGRWRVNLSHLEHLEVPRTVNETLTRRLRKLSEGERAVIRVLSVFNRPLPRSLLARAGDWGEPALGALVSGLVARGLLVRTEQGGEERVGFAHMKTRDLVYRGLAAERARLHQRAGELLEDANRGRGEDALEELAYHFLQGGSRVKGLEYAELAGDKSARLYAYEAAREFYRKSLSLLPRTESRRRMEIFAKIARIATQSADYAEMQDYLNRALRIARTLGDRRREGHLIASVAYGHLLQGHLELAVRTAGAALAILEPLEDSLGMGRAKNFIATACARMGRLDEAVPQFVQALGHLERSGDSWQTVNVRNNLGNVYLSQNRLEEARQLFEDSLQTWRELADKRGEAMTRANLGQTLKDLGKLEEAAASAADAIRLYRGTLDRTHLAVTLALAAEIEIARGAYDRALDLAEESLQLRRLVGEVATSAYSLDILGSARRRSGDLVGAVQAHQDGIELAREGKNDLQEGFLLVALAGDALEEGRVPEASFSANRALGIGRRTKVRKLEVLALETLALAAMASDHDREAAARSRELETLAASGDSEETRFRADRALGLCLLRGEEWEKATSTLVRALEASRRQARKDREAQLCLTLARAAEKTGNPARVAEFLRRASESIQEIASRIEDSAVRRRFLSTGMRQEIREWREKIDAGTALPNELSPGKVPPMKLLATIYEVSQIINSLRDLTDLLNRVLDLAIQIVGAERGLIFLRENGDGELKVRVARNLEHETIRDAGEYSQRILREATAGRSIVTLDAGSDQRFEAFDSVSLYRIRSLVCVPLRLRDRVLGTVYLDSRRPDVLFGEEDVQFLEAFANQAAIAIENARLVEALKEENRYLRKTVEARYGFDGIVGDSPALRRALERVDRIAESDLPVIIQGESGTGKELVARAIHFNSPRRERRFVTENVAALPETLLESELFGHVKGAFTGAEQERAGLFEQADGGTLFLDEVGEMSLALQSKLLRVVQEGEVRPVGGERTRRVNVRILAATNRDLKALVAEKKFREDLFYRLNVVTLTLPPLRQRKEDLPLLVEHFLARIARERGARPLRMEPSVLALLSRHHWPGNIRELENTLSRLSLFATGPSITLTDLAQDPGLLDRITDLPGGGKAPEPLLNRRELKRALKATGGNRVQAAALLGVSRATLFRKLRQFQIKD